MTVSALTIAGSDPSGGAGLQADLKAFEQLGVYGMSVITLLTVQNTQGVEHVETIAAELVEQQLGAVIDDIQPHAIKTGALGDGEILRAVTDRLTHLADLPHVVIDPVLVSKHGHRLADDAIIDDYRERLLPLATVVTPNRFEAEALLELPNGSLDKDTTEQSWLSAAKRLRDFGPQAVLLKGGRVGSERVHAYCDGVEESLIRTQDIDTRKTHGAGCNLSATLTALLALNRMELQAACHQAIEAVSSAIKFAPNLGSGQGPLQTQMLREYRPPRIR
ncbi:MAG: bifunctional hydroxymethylpyrimidine kinase/phosphomethylpyrimidine kinase [Planctomycetota bacterium]